MFSSNIEFKNFSQKKNNSKVKKILNKLLDNYLKKELSNLAKGERRILQIIYVVN